MVVHQVGISPGRGAGGSHAFGPAFRQRPQIVETGGQADEHLCRRFLGEGDGHHLGRQDDSPGQGMQGPFHQQAGLA